MRVGRRPRLSTHPLIRPSANGAMERNLWSFSQRFRDSALGVKRLPGGTVVVSDGALAHDVLTARKSEYEPQSGFFRLGANVLPPAERSALTHGLVSLLRQHRRAPACGIDRFFRDRAGQAPVQLHHQGWGPRFVRDYFARVIARDRPDELQRVIDDLLDRSIIPDDIRGRVFGTYRALPSIDDRLEMAFSAAGSTKNAPYDLFGLLTAHDIALSPRQRAELFRRLVLSFVGFLGVALEWSVLLAAGRRWTHDTAVKHHVAEALRLYPPAWRLLRVAASPHSLGGLQIGPGDTVLMLTSAIHRSPKAWTSPNLYRPARWQEASSSPGADYLPFGKGPEMCPAKFDALAMLEHCTEQITARYRVESRTRRASSPRVLTLMAPPAGSTVLSDRCRLAREGIRI